MPTGSPAVLALLLMSIPCCRSGPHEAKLARVGEAMPSRAVFVLPWVWLLSCVVMSQLRCVCRAAVAAAVVATCAASSQSPP